MSPFTTTQKQTKITFFAFLLLFCLPIFSLAQYDVTATIDDDLPGAFGTFELTITVTNNSTTAAVNDLAIRYFGCGNQGGPLFDQSFGIVYEGSPDDIPSVGTFNFVSRNWFIPSLAPATSSTLKIRFFTLTDEPRNIIVSGLRGSGGDCQANGNEEAIVEINGDGGGNLPDLNLARLTNLPSAADPGAVVEFNFDLINSGAAMAAGEFSIGAYLSIDSNFGNADDVKVGEINTGNTSVGTISDVLGAITIPNNTPTGSYFLLLVADDGEAIPETDETNNFLSGNIFVNDIIGGECTPPQIINTEVVCITNDVPALLIEWNPVSTAESYELELTNLSTGVVVTETITRTRYVTTSFDFNTNYGLELTAVCNGGERATTSIDFGTNDPTYDFFGLFGTAANYFDQNNSVSAEVRMKNAGLASADIEIDYYLSSNPTLSNDDIFISRLNGFVIGCVTERSFFISSFFSSLPANVPPGDYYILANFDPDNDFAELDESNNIAASLNTITIPGETEGPTVNLSTPSTTVDGAFPVQATFSESVTDFTLAEIEVTNGTKSNAAQQSGSSYSFTVTPTNPGQVTVSVLANSAFDSDGNGNQPSNTLNITFDTGTELPDISAGIRSVGAFPPPISGEPADYLQIEFVVNPNGTDVDENLPFKGRFYFSKDRSFSPDDVLGFDFSNPSSEVFSFISNGISIFTQGAEIGFPASLPLDNYFLIGVLDSENEVTETNESNNILISEQSFEIGNNIGGGEVDLELSVSTANNNPTQYAFFGTTFTLTNNGTEAVSGIQLRWLNQGAGFVPRGGMEADASQGSVSPVSQQWNVGSLAAGESATITLEYFNLDESQKKVWAEVTAQTPSDVDSAPDNGMAFIANEDDEALIVINEEVVQDGFDLEISEFTAPNEIRFNSIGAITVGTVTNIGNQTSPRVFLRVYISEDDQFNIEDDVLYASSTLQPLAPGASDTEAPQRDRLFVEGLFGLDRNRPSNYWIVVAQADLLNGEQNTSNNVFAIPFSVVVPDYDVEVKANTPPPTNVEAGQLYDLDMSVVNTGSANYSITIFDRGGSASSVLDIATSSDLSVPAITTLFRRGWSTLPFASPMDMVIPADLPDGEYILRWYVNSNLTEVTKENNVLTFPLRVGTGTSEDCGFIRTYSLTEVGEFDPQDELSLNETTDGYTINAVDPFVSFRDPSIEQVYKLNLQGDLISAEEIPFEPAYDVKVEITDNNVELVFFKSPDVPVGTRVPIDIDFENPTSVIGASKAFKTSNGYAFGLGIVDTSADPIISNQVVQTDDFGQNVIISVLPDPAFFGGFGRLEEGPDGGIYTWWTAAGNFSLYGVPADGSPAWRFGVAGDTPSTRWTDTHVSADGQFVYVGKTDNQRVVITKLNSSDGTPNQIDLSEFIESETGGNYFRSFLGGILPTEDGGLLVAMRGGALSTGGNGSTSALLLGKFDANNNLVWKREITEGSAAVRPVGETSDGGALFAGIEGEFDPNPKTVFIKTTAFSSVLPDCGGGTNEGVDLELSLSANNPNPGIYNNVTLTTTISNTGTEAATDILIYLNGCDPTSNSCCTGFNQGFDLVYANTITPSTAGNYDFLEQAWTIPSLGAGESASLEVTLFTLVADPKNIYAKVMMATGDDVDSTPGNNFGGNDFDCMAVEDDEADLVINASGVAARISSDNRSETEKQYNITQQLDYVIHKTFPTLAENEVNVLIFSKKETQMDMVIYDMQGQAIQQQRVDIIAGPNRIQVNTSELTSGMHNIMFIPKEGVRGKPLTTRFIKQRL